MVARFASGLLSRNVGYKQRLTGAGYRKRVMNKIMALIFLLVGLSGCDAGLSFRDDGQPPAYAANDALGSALAQASIGAADLSP
jgi:hypothetical protein